MSVLAALGVVSMIFLAILSETCWDLSGWIVKMLEKGM